MPAGDHETMRALSDAQVQQFIEDGFVRIDRAFPRELYRRGPCHPVAGHRMRSGRPGNVEKTGHPARLLRAGAVLRTAVNTPVLHAAFDSLVGKGRWRPRHSLGSFPVRFPGPDNPGDTGWHVDVSFPGESSNPNEREDFSSWRVNVTSRGRALLMLFLFSDLTDQDAPTRIRAGSHLHMARFLAPAGEIGISHLVLDRIGTDRPEALATGEAGTVYLRHPLLVHAAQ